VTPDARRRRQRAGQRARRRGDRFGGNANAATARPARPSTPWSDHPAGPSGKPARPLTGFGGAEDATAVADPTDATNKVARIVKSATAELWAGTTVALCPKDAVARIPFTDTQTRMSARVWSPAAGIPVRMKVENSADGTQSVETEATVTTANGWQVLTFDFARPGHGHGGAQPGTDLRQGVGVLQFRHDRCVHRRAHLLPGRPVLRRQPLHTGLSQHRGRQHHHPHHG
jgi:hypothetical protein